MITHADAMLKAWGRWLLTNRGQGSKILVQDYTKFKVDAPLQKSARLHPPVPNVNLSAARTHGWVMAQPKPEREILVEAYAHGCKRQDMADRRGVQKKTLYNRLHSLHVRYMEWVEKSEQAKK